MGGAYRSLLSKYEEVVLQCIPLYSSVKVAAGIVCKLTKGEVVDRPVNTERLN